MINLHQLLPFHLLCNKNTKKEINFAVYFYLVKKLKTNIMLKHFIILLSFLFVQQSFGQAIKISDARKLDTPSVVTVRGIVTNGTELGQTIRYFQDSTGGLSAFYSAAGLPAFANVKRGNVLEVTGKLKLFRGLLEIDPIQSFTILDSNKTVAPLSIDTSGMVEANECKLVKLPFGTFTASNDVTFLGNKSYEINIGAKKIVVRINNNSAIIGRNFPKGEVSLTGIVSEFSGVYQLLPRDYNDFQFKGIALTKSPTLVSNTTSAITLNWETNLTGSTQLLYGLTPDLGQKIDSLGSKTSHLATISGLAPATIIYVQSVTVNSFNTADTIKSAIQAFITTSTSSGEVRVFFNRSVDTTVAIPATNKPAATTGSKCESELVSLITKATQTIDVAMYSNANIAIRDALKAAAARGVRVRYIADKNANSSIFGDSATLGFRFIRKPADELMHNKFFIVDAGDAQKSWVSTGSTNLTTNQLFTDYNNMIWIQDQGLAKTFTVEFEEMWGSSTATPNITKGKFGALKSSDTPQKVTLGNGKKVDVHFSPSDGTSKAIFTAISTADNDVEAALLLVTFFDLGTALNNSRIRGADTRVLVHNDTVGTSAQLRFLLGNGGKVKLFPGTDIFHHKYCIIDGKKADSNPILITGSHNWSNTAETRNDENTLFIYDAAIANLYLQEFEARWKTTISDVKDAKIEGFDVKIYPNPVSDLLTIDMKNEVSERINLTIYNAAGQPVEAYFMNQTKGEMTKMIPLSNYTAGQYFIRFDVDGKITTKAIQVVK
jgi:phosphatidylserine/phosphatidylglycerophosphate/cardiolipin synthase-like enzyme/DNA/RNA endonuclease YhcR with UshA esterase domain